MTDKKLIFKSKWVQQSNPGYVVYRDIFDTSKCSLQDGIKAHTIALFVSLDDAESYCDYRNAALQVEWGVVEHSESWICLLCKSGRPGHHGTLDDGVTPCPNAVLSGAATEVKPRRDV